MPDLSIFDPAPEAAAGVPMQIESPADGEPLVDGAGNPVTVTLVGQDAKECLAVIRKQQARRINAATSSGRLKLSPEEVDDEQIELLVACTKGWSGLEDKGAVLAFTPDAASFLYGKYRWLREQASRFINNRANFLGNSLKNSTTSPAKSST